MVRIVVAGAAGRMGGHIIRAVKGEPDMALAGATERPGFHTGEDAGTLAGLPGAAVWWDARGDWRRRWGHRVYGEVMSCDRAGRFLGTRPPE